MSVNSPEITKIISTKDDHKKSLLNDKQSIDDPPLKDLDSSTKLDWKYEAKKLIVLGGPIGFGIMTELLQLLTCQATVGHLGTDYLAASSMATVWQTITFTLILGFTGVINALSSQAFGAKNYKLVSEWYQIGALLTFFLTLPVITCYMYTEPVLKLFGTNDNIAQLAGKFSKYCVFGVIPDSQALAVSMYFKSQSNVLPYTVVSGIMIIVNLVLNLGLVYGYIFNWFVPSFKGYGFIGSPIANSITRTLQCIVYFVFMFGIKKYHKYPINTWSPIIKNFGITFSFDRIKGYFAVALPQTISYALEDWQIQIISLFAAQLNDEDIAAFSSLITILITLHCVIIGLSDAVSVRVGNSLGNNNPLKARFISNVAMLMAGFVGIFVGLILATCNQYIARIVSNDADVINIYKILGIITGIGMLELSVFTIGYGVLIGQARTIGLAICAFVSCWLISVPSSYLLGLYWNYGIVGIWSGVMAGYTTFSISVLILYFTSNWYECARLAVQRSKDHQNNDTNSTNNDTSNKSNENNNPNINDDDSNRDRFISDLLDNNDEAYKLMKVNNKKNNELP